MPAARELNISKTDLLKLKKMQRSGITEQRQVQRVSI